MPGGGFVMIEVVQPGQRADELLYRLDAALPDVRIDPSASPRLPVIVGSVNSEDQAKATLEKELDALEDASDWREVLQVKTSVAVGD